jgi:hypothetical protein
LHTRVNLSHVDDVDIFPILEAFRYVIPEVEVYLRQRKSLPKDLVFDFENSHSFSEFEKFVRNTMELHKNLKYDVAVDAEGDNTITLLKPNDLEQLNIFICDFCGAVSSSEEEKYIHQRAHYFF